MKAIGSCTNTQHKGYPGCAWLRREREKVMIVLEYWETTQIKYWINLDDPVFGKSLWLRDKNGNNSRLVTKIPKRFKKYFDEVKNANL